MKFYKWAYIIFTAILLVIIVLTIVSNMGGISTVIVFAAFVALQVICLFNYKGRLNIYGIGFYILHIGLVVFLAGSFVYYMAGDSVNVSVPIDQNATYNRISRLGEGKSDINLGFEFGVADFNINYYPDTIIASRYEAILMFYNANAFAPEYIPLVVNKPVMQNGWRIYLMGHNPANESVNLFLKNNPGELLTLIGLWSIIIGTVIICFIRKRKAGNNEH